MLLELAWRSLWHRRSSVALTLLSITLSVLLVLGVEHLRVQARDSFARTLSGVDLVVGARTSPVNLLLHAVFGIGAASNGVDWHTYRQIGADPRVAWHVPLSLGDSHQGYRVLGTTEAYFAHYRYGQRTPLVLQEGDVFGAGPEAVLGAEVARALGYRLGSTLILAHGLGETSFAQHAQTPFTVSGILQPTGTPVDQTIHVSLASLEHVHEPHAGTAHPETRESGSLTGDDVADADEPEAITAFLLGLHSRAAAFGLQRDINDYRGEALTALLPGLVLAELWESLAFVERLLRGIAVLVMLATLLGLATMLLSAMQSRRHEIALYRALGAGPLKILLLIELETVVVCLLGIGCAFLLALVLLQLGQAWVAARWGLFIGTMPLGGDIPAFLGLILGSAMLLALIPAVSAYRSALGERLVAGS